MTIREVTYSDFDKLQELYLHLHEDEKLPKTDEYMSLWREIIDDKSYHILAADIDSRLVSSVTLVIIKNLTRGARPYAVIENVVTHPDYRRKGYAAAVMKEACTIAKKADCYKVMLLTGSKDKGILDFYDKCGFNSKDKTAFIKWISFER